MNTKQLIDLANKLEIKYYNECNDYICLKGINGMTSILYTSKSKLPSKFITATGVDFRNHILQMGRDSLKMELDRLLNITTHG